MSRHGTSVFFSGVPPDVPSKHARLLQGSLWRGFWGQMVLVVFSMMKHNTIKMRGTPAKFNMEPENDGFQNESPFPGTSFQVPC